MNVTSSSSNSPLFDDKEYSRESVFLAKNLIREARRQKGIAEYAVPRICLLDPDGDILACLRADGKARHFPEWPCYHTQMHTFNIEGQQIGIIPHVVGGPFAVLVAEQLFAAGCEALLSITSAGQLAASTAPPYFVLIEKALRDEGTSHHYLAPAAQFAEAPPEALGQLKQAFVGASVKVLSGATWTTDAPYRETATAIERKAAAGILAVEMEAASLYAFAKANERTVICFAHVTNQMATEEGDFEKGEASGARDALRVIAHAVQTLKGGFKK
jgi:uridine phosphorylase